ncbi:MAG: hypothetical protein HY451_01120 [Parcubacteria group bacterium]|nr:hypothetical protein [Parcubacteria group bacterium]
MPELEFLPEKTKRIDTGAKMTFGSGSLVLIIVLVLWGGLLFYNRTLENKIKGLDDAFVNFNNARDKAEEVRVDEVKSKLDQSQIFLEEHALWSKGFKKIQQLTLPAVQFQSLAASLPELKFEFKATAPNLTSIARQSANFLADESVSDVSINQIKTLTVGRTEFVIKITFDRDKFLK